MLPSVKQQVPYDQVTDEKSLLRLASDAEKLILDELNYVPPPLPGHSVFPELSYKEDSQVKAPQQPRSAVAAISAPINADDKVDLSTMLSRIMALESSFAKTKAQQNSASKANYKGNNGKDKGSSGSNKSNNDGSNLTRNQITKNLISLILRLLHPKMSKTSHLLIQPKPRVGKSSQTRRK